MESYDYIIVGSGIAGLYTAILAREMGAGSVLLLTKGSLEECNTRYAQGGIAAAIGPGDSPELHYKDTHEAGAGLCIEDAVRVLTEEAPKRIHDLIRFGVPFDTQDGEVSLTRESAHSVSRILHAGGDATGEHIETTLSNMARRSGVIIREYSLVAQIILESGVVKGVDTLDTLSNSHQEYRCQYLILATGGSGRLYKVSTNPAVATGDGVALAYRCGAEITDMEFFQFHPTALRLPGAPPFLITEAIRGEGGVLLNVRGHRFMEDYSPQGELAPRDVVARSIWTELQKTASDHALLDVTNLKPEYVSGRFPTIYRFCLDYGVDMTKEPIPIAPAAHYMMGGVRTNVWGETNIPGLYACGEVACTGVHGANRLASNSLLETLIFGYRIVQRTQEGTRISARDPHSAAGDGLIYHLGTQPLPRIEPPPVNLAALQSVMWEKVGIVRSGEGLQEAAAILEAWSRSLEEPADKPSHELANLVTVGRLVTEAALMRQESRGAHYRSDYPDPSDQWLRHIVFTRNGE
ncbi:MAG: nadB [Dehalococcoidia bacterium]|nr:nadB [Dehalococcoidia bacterium]